MNSGLAPLRTLDEGVDVEAAAVGGEDMKIARDNRDYHTIQVVLLSERSPSTALATGRFGLGLDIAFAAVL